MPAPPWHRLLAIRVLRALRAVTPPVTGRLLISSNVYGPCRVGAGCCQPTPPSEPYVKVSLHTAQATQTLSPMCEQAVTVRLPLRYSRLLARHQPRWVACQKTHQLLAQPSCLLSSCVVSSTIFRATSHQTDVGISGALHTGVGFFGLPNAVPPTRLAVRSARLRTGTGLTAFPCSVNGTGWFRSALYTDGLWYSRQGM